jgi:hypothetical protein
MDIPLNRHENSGCSAAWQRIWFGTRGSEVRILSPRFRICRSLSAAEPPPNPRYAEGIEQKILKKIIFVYQYPLTSKHKKWSFWGAFGLVWDPRKWRVHRDPRKCRRGQNPGEPKCQAVSEIVGFSAVSPKIRRVIKAVQTECALFTPRGSNPAKGMNFRWAPYRPEQKSTRQLR